MLPVVDRQGRKCLLGPPNGRPTRGPFKALRRQGSLRIGHDPVGPGGAGADMGSRGMFTLHPALAGWRPRPMAVFFGVVRFRDHCDPWCSREHMVRLPPRPAGLHTYTLFRGHADGRLADGGDGGRLPVTLLRGRDGCGFDRPGGPGNQQRWDLRAWRLCSAVTEPSNVALPMCSMTWLGPVQRTSRRRTGVSELATPGHDRPRLEAGPKPRREGHVLAEETHPHGAIGTTAPARCDPRPGSRDPGRARPEDGPGRSTETLAPGLHRGSSTQLAGPPSHRRRTDPARGGRRHFAARPPGLEPGGREALTEASPASVGMRLRPGAAGRRDRLRSERAGAGRWPKRLVGPARSPVQVHHPGPAAGRCTSRICGKQSALAAHFSSRRRRWPTWPSTPPGGPGVGLTWSYMGTGRPGRTRRERPRLFVNRPRTKRGFGLGSDGGRADPSRRCSGRLCRSESRTPGAGTAISAYSRAEGPPKRPETATVPDEKRTTPGKYTRRGKRSDPSGGPADQADDRRTTPVGRDGPERWFGRSDPEVRVLGEGGRPARKAVRRVAGAFL